MEVEAIPLFSNIETMTQRIYEEKCEEQPVNPAKDRKPSGFICRFAAVFSNIDGKQHQEYVDKLIDS